MLHLLQSILALTSLATASVLPRQTAQACNNSPDLCSKPYNSVVHLGAHDSAFVRDASTDDSTSGNQFYNTTVQLSAGVRLVTAQMHNSNGDIHLCHTSCDLLDAGTLEQWLSEIKTWLDNNPDEVVTVLLINSDNNEAADIGAQFESAGINQYAYTPSSTTQAIATWPTLQDMISANKRLVSVVASLSPPSTTPSQFSYLLDEFTFFFENPFTNANFSSFTCAPDRPTSVQNNIQAAIGADLMPLVNHFLDTSGLFGIDTPDTGNITTTNADGSQVGMLGQAATACTEQYGRKPWGFLVDFFDQASPINVVDQLNGVTNPVGRTEPPPRDTSTSASDRSAESFKGVVALREQVKQGERPSKGAWIWAAGDWSWGGINLSGGQLLS